MSIIQGTAKATAGDASFYNFPIDQSLRFDGSSYLSRTFGSPTDGTKYTFSCWVKRSTLGSDQFITGRLVSPYYDAGINFNSGNNLIIGDYNAGKITSSAVFRDTSAWYHIVSQRNDANGKLVLWINGVKIQEVSATGATSYNSSGFTVIGALYYNNYLYYLNGYLAEINFIDGQALDPYFFGEFKNGVWIPYNAFSTAGSGTATASDGGTATDSYGTNGFRLAFASSDFNTTSSAMSDPHGSSTDVPAGYVADASGSGNHWNVN